MAEIHKEQRPVAEDILQDEDIGLIVAVAEMVAAQEDEMVEQMAVVDSVRIRVQVAMGATPMHKRYATFVRFRAISRQIVTNG